MYPIKDLLIDGIDAQQKVEVPPKPSSLSIQELFINVHRSLKLKQDEESRLRNAALRLPRPVPKRHPEKHKKLSKEEKREKDRKIAVLGLYDCIQTGRSHDEVIRQFVKHNISMHVQQERNCLIELRRPGGGVMTMDFCTMGMFIIDSILPAPLREPQYNVIGGVKPSYTFLIENDSFFEQAGTYAMIGARFFRKPPSTKLVGSVIHLGSDFTDRLHKEILSWETNSLFIPTPDRPTTRATNLYFAAGHRVFEYVTEKIQIEPTLLDREQLFSKTFHLICSPTRCIEIVNGLLDARDKAIVPELQAKNTTKMRPIFVWEPVPDSCKPSELENLLEALKHVDVVSPNHLELQSLFGETPDGDLPIDDSILRRRCNVLLAKGFGAKPSAVVVRLGERGCYVAQMIRHIFLPAYHRPRSDLNETEKSAWTEKVADPTGGGNAFLGGYCIGLLTAPCPLGLTEFEMAAVYGSVAASFVIEQFGMPKLSIRESDGQELWNGESAHDRMNMYERRLDVPKLTEQQLERASLYADANEPPSVLDIDNEQGIPIKKMVRKSGLQTKKQSPPVEG